MTVDRITNDHDLVQAIEVTATDLLQLLVREEVTRTKVFTATRNALNEIVRESNETSGAEAIRLTGAFRTPVVDHNRPPATEALFFQWYISQDDLADLMWRLCGMLTPAASQRVGDKAIITFRTPIR